jgi:DNA repair exonuclease SbcCD ATPase subunit
MGSESHPENEDFSAQATEESDARPPDRRSETADRGETQGSPLDRFLPDSLRMRSTRASRRNEQKAMPYAGGEQHEVPRHFAEVGTHVKLVLVAAEHAAEQIRQEAREAANGVRANAGRDAARIRHEAEEALRASERQRAEIEEYVRQTRARAEAQMTQTLREAEAKAAEIGADAASAARRVVAEAKQRGQEIEDAARRRSQQLAKEAADLEERLDGLLDTLRKMTNQLEEQLGFDGRPKAGARSESLDEAITGPSTGRAPSQKRSSR